MLAFVLLLAILLLLVLTPWRRLPLAGRVWSAASLFNTFIFLGMPTTAATSPWRPVVGRVMAGSAAASLGLLFLGLVLWQRHGRPQASGGSAWAGPLILSALPIAFYAFFSILGPLY
jgi:hypothetical protein